MQTAIGRNEALASAPTFSRLENRTTRAKTWALHEVLAARFIASHDKPPEELVLGIDVGCGGGDQAAHHAAASGVACGPLHRACRLVLLPSPPAAAVDQACTISWLVVTSAVLPSRMVAEQ